MCNTIVKELHSLLNGNTSEVDCFQKANQFSLNEMENVLINDMNGFLRSNFSLINKLSIVSNY